jgi:hypothetical protein
MPKKKKPPRTLRAGNTAPADDNDNASAQPTSMQPAPHSKRLVLIGGVRLKGFRLVSQANARNAAPPTENTNASPPAPAAPTPTRKPSPLDTLVPRTRPRKRDSAKLSRSTQGDKAKRR